MTTRHCPSCRAEVEDTGGFCLLGHDLGLKPPMSSLPELRAEVDRVFEEAEVEVATAMRPPPPPPGPPSPVPAVVSATPPAPPPPDRVTEQPGVEARRSRSSIAAFAPSPVVAGKPEAESDRAHDPISAFAPPPRMDWGPQRRLSRLRTKAAQ